MSCNDHFHLVSNKFVRSAQGYCEWCFEELYDMYPTCGVKEWNDEVEECNCGLGQWYDAKNHKCRNCSHHCLECVDVATPNGYHCKQCEEGFSFLVGSDICVKYCPTGYFANAQVCSGEPHYVVDLTFEIQREDM
ncbi:MAG: hypothetical protein V2I33_20095 [Kangiellaceae bacterium]|nr:hypothetical protein [Kangiellaceae bacterium]